MSTRVIWVDNAKAIGIFLVVFGHLSNPELVTNIIYSFHMPLFFFLSGLFFSHSGDTSEFMFKKAKSILIPYFIFGIVTYMFWLFIGRKFGADSALDLPWWKPIIGMFYSVGTNNWLQHNTPLWFLTCLYLSEIFFFLLLKVTKTIAIWLIVISVLGYLLSLYSIPSLPWSLNTTPQAILFLGAGFLAKKFIHEPNNILAFIIFAICITGIYFIESFNGRIDLSSNRYGNYLLFFTSSALGIAAVIVLSQKVNFRPINMVGRHTLVIFLLHGVAVSAYKGVLVLGLGFSLDLFESNIAINFLLTTAVLLSLTPVSMFITKLAPWATGAKHNKLLQPIAKAAAE